MPAETTPQLKLWADKLDALLQKAASVRMSGDTMAVVGVQRELRQFKLDSPDYADALDTQASLAIFDLDLASTEEAVSAIKQRAAEVYRLTKLITAVSDEANASASILNGTALTQTIDAANSAISAFRGLRAQLSDQNSSEASIAAEIDLALDAVQRLRGKLESGKG